MASRLFSNPPGWRVGALSLALLCGVPSVTDAAPSLGSAATSPPPRAVKWVPASNVTAVPAGALTTAWPLVLPCVSPRWLNVAGYEGTLLWSNRVASKQVSLGEEAKRETLVLPPSLGSELLERIWVSSGPIVAGVYLDCKPSDEDNAEHAIEWSLGDGQPSFEVTARYAVATTPRAWRVNRWIEPQSRNLLAPERDKPAHFTSQIVAARDPRAAAAASVRFTRDILADLRDLIALACAGRRCANSVQSLGRAALRAARDANPVHERLDRRSGEVEPFGHKYEWRVSTQESETRVGCYATSTDQILCELTLTTVTGESLRYDAWYSELELLQPRGAIEFSTAPSGAARVTISGAALALRGVEP